MTCRYSPHLDQQINQRSEKIEEQGQETNQKVDKLSTFLNGLGLAAAIKKISEVATTVTNIWNKLNKVADWLQLDRILNILIWWQTLHNAYMLSANLGSTLFSALSNVLAAIGIKDAEGSPIDIGAIFGKEVDYFAKGLFGIEQWEKTKAEYKKWNRVYQAAANLMFSLQSIGYSILGAMEIVGSWVAWIGNALKAFGGVGEKAYRWMNPQPNFQNRFFTAINQADDIISQIDMVAQETLSVPVPF